MESDETLYALQNGTIQENEEQGKWSFTKTFDLKSGYYVHLSSHTKGSKMEIDNTLLNTQHHKVRIKGKVGQSRERSCALPYNLV